MNDTKEDEALAWKLNELAQMLKGCNNDDAAECIMEEAVRVSIEAGWSKERMLEVIVGALDQANGR